MDAINSSDPNNFALGITDYAQTDDQSATFQYVNFLPSQELVITQEMVVLITIMSC